MTPPLELPLVHVTPAAPRPAYAPTSPDRDRLIRRAKTLSWLSLAWLTIEGSVGVIAGASAGSVALLGFGLDSAIEGLASVIIIWRFTGARRQSDAAELRAQKLVAISFFLLAPYIAADAIISVLSGSEANTSWAGIGLTITTLLICPWLGRAKQRIGTQLQSAATRGEGTQNVLCAYLATGVLTGLIANTTLGWWWLDPLIALTIAAVAVKEGRAAWRGDSCDCCTPVIINREAPPLPVCHDDCCA